MNSFMQVADTLARENIITNSGGPFGAVVVKDGKIVGKGKNQVIEKNDPTCHAEMMAIREASQNLQTFDLSGCELYTSCYPCPMCLAAIIWSNIKEVYYGNNKEDATKIGFRDDMIYSYISDLKEGKQREELLKLIPLNHDETIKAFEEYDKKTDKVLY